MAQLTQLEEKLGEVYGLARAAEKATAKVTGLLDGADDASGVLATMHDEARETAERCRDLVGERTGRKTAIEEKARETTREATEMMSTYLGDDADGLDGFEFLTMAEAGEVGHWEVLGAMAGTAGEREVQELVKWALPIQERHLRDARRCCVALAKAADPNEES